MSIRTYKTSFWSLMLVMFLVLSELGAGMFAGYKWLKEEILNSCYLFIDSIGKAFLSLSVLQMVSLTVMAFILLSFIRAFFRAVCSIKRTRSILNSIGFCKSADVCFDGSVNIDRKHIRFLQDREPFAFTVGYLKPLIVISNSMLEGMKKAEKNALLLHEEAHRRRKDPLRQLFVNFLSDALWYMPWIRKLKGIFEISKEMVADDEAILRGQQPLALAGAILKSVRGRAAFNKLSQPISLFSMPSSLEVRLNRIINGEKPSRERGFEGSLSKVLFAGLAPLVIIFLVGSFYMSVGVGSSYSGILMGIKCL